MHLAIRAVKKDDLAQVKTFLIITLGLGLAFVFTQFIGWNELIKNGVHFVDKTTPSGSFFFALPDYIWPISLSAFWDSS
jgi:cytochrome c oxidase subunit 3